MVDVSYKNGLVSKTDVAELSATVTNITYDELVWSDTNVTSYSEWNNVVKTSGVKYNGNTTKNTKDGHDQIQLRSASKSGIWTSAWSTGKGGNIKSASLVWGPSTTTTRALEFYGRNTGYAGTEMPTSDPGLESPGSRDLGTYLGCITWGTDSSGNPNPTSVSFTGSYQYVCAVGLGGAMYLDSLTFGWG